MSPPGRKGAIVGLSKIIIGYDPSDRGERAFDAGVELALALGADIHLVTAFSDGPGGGVEITAERRAAEQKLAKAASRKQLAESSVECHAMPLAPAKAILQVADEVDADLIVLGNRGAQGATRVLGSVAAAVVGHAPCSVVVVKTA